MSEERFAEGSQEELEHRGHKFTVELDGRFYWDMLYSIFDDEVPPSFYENGPAREDVTPMPDAADDRQARVREWLKSVTVERGFSEAEEATAKQKLAEMDKAA